MADRKKKAVIFVFEFPPHGADGFGMKPISSPLEKIWLISWDHFQFDINPQFYDCFITSLTDYCTLLQGEAKQLN